MNLKYVTFLVLISFTLSFTSFADEFTTSGGDTVEDLGGGEYMTGSGEIVETEDLGGGESMTSGDQIIEDMAGSGEYEAEGGETLRDMSD